MPTASPRNDYWSEPITKSPGIWRTEASNGALSVLDLSHARVVIRIEGLAAPDLLARLVSLDLYTGAFAEGRFALTGIDAVPVMLHRLADGADAPRYDLFVPYSWAASLWDLTCHSALSLGYEVSGKRHAEARFAGLKNQRIWFPNPA